MERTGLSEREREALRRLRSLLEQGVGLLDLRVFGSKARGDAEPDSDIDVMIEVERYTREVEAAVDEIIFRINLEFDCFISAVIYGRQELEEGPMAESPLYKAIQREGVRV